MAGLDVVMLVRAAGIIIYRRFNDQLQYLLLQSSKNPHHWTPPKGHLEDGETDLQAAYREVMEEAGLQENQIRLIDSQIPLEYTAHGKPKKVTYWIGELVDPETPITISHEHRRFSWADLEEAKRLVAYEDAQKLFDTCHLMVKEELVRMESK